MFINNLEKDLPLPKRDIDISSQPSLIAKKVKTIVSHMLDNVAHTLSVSHVRQ